jgi:hypothetical protein
MLFGRKQKTEGKTVLVLDIENGSVGSALARMRADGSLTILDETRQHMPIRGGRSADGLAQETQKLVREATVRAAEFASRLRQGPEPSLGVVNNISVFMSPPWGKPNLETGKPDFVPHMKDLLVQETSPYFDASLNFYTNAGAATQGMRALSPYEDKYLLCIVTHEMTELLLIYNGAVVGHASMPHGMNLPLRTLKTHGGLSDAEARSALTLRHLTEPLSSATEHYAHEFKNAARDLLDTYVPQQVWVVSPAGEYFARALSHESLEGLFPQGGRVAAVRPKHFEQHLPGSSSQDLFLILEALYLRYTQ